jgi:hypothetical protein
MMREPRPWWVTRTTVVNVTLLILVGLFIVWTSLG